VLVAGANGVGKTNLLESLHLGTQGFSPRNRTDAQLIRFGEDAARVTVSGSAASRPIEATIVLRAGQAKEARLNGARLASAESLRREISTLVFTPDRLAVVKGGPAVRRAYIDRSLGRLQPAHAGLPQAYLAALAQRNAALRRVQLGLSARSALEPWTEQIAVLGAELVGRRHSVLSALTTSFAECASALGLADGSLRYDGEPPAREQLESRLDRDIDRGSTGLGPHLDDAVVTSGTRDLRQFGSQGEQRIAVLSLLLAEARLLPSPPLLLLDDVLSELDLDRRRALAGLLSEHGQTVITTTHASALPADPAQIVEVEPGTAR
jgi:DNA replication and repair protein RecF